MRTSFAFRTDGNHKAIKAALEGMGWLVFSTSPLPGWIDLTGYRPSHGVVLFEVKKDAKAKLKPSQEALIKAGWPIVRLDSVADAEWYTKGPHENKV